MKIAATALGLLLVMVRAYAQNAVFPDSEFGTDGVATHSMTGFGFQANATALQADGKIVSVGNAVSDSINAVVVVRCNADGSLDSSFGDGGRSVFQVGHYCAANAVAVKPNGAIVVAGLTESSGGKFLALQLSAAGRRDSTFGDHGQVTIDASFADNGATCVAVQSDGKILLGGGNRVVRLDPNGGLDFSFGFNGVANTNSSGWSSDENLMSVALQPDGKAVATGYNNHGSQSGHDFMTVRFSLDGKLDTSFQHNGKAVLNFYNDEDKANRVLPCRDGSLVVTGWAIDYTPLTNAAAVRYTTDGALDTAFGNDGLGVGPPGTVCVAAAMDSSERLLMACMTADGFSLFRRGADGRFDSAFAADAALYATVPHVHLTDAAVQPDQKILVSGYTVDGAAPKLFLARYRTDFSSTANSLTLSAYPSLLDGTDLALRYRLPSTTNVDLALYDALGRRVQAFVVNGKRLGGWHTEHVAVQSHLAPGLYVVALYTNEGNASTKLVVK